MPPVTETTSFLEGVNACSTVFEWVKCVGFLNQIRTPVLIIGSLGALSIPIVIWVVTGRREKTRLTIRLMSDITTLHEVVDRQERLYLYRKCEDYEKIPQEKRTGANLKNPYENCQEKLLFDSAIFLNYIEAACFEIEQRTVYRKPLYETADAVILGAKDVVLNRYVKLTGINAERHYPYILKVARRLEKKNKKSPAQTLIPDLQTPQVESPSEER